MATFNGERFLKAQLNSILTQERVPDEIVVSDDHSTDKTLEILKEFQRDTAVEIVILRNEGKSGYTQNFANALSHATGDLVFLSDQDDVWYKSKIRKVTELASRFPNQFAFLNDAELTDAELNPTGLTKLGQLRAAGISRDHFVMGCCAAVRRELLRYCLPIPSDFKGHDNWIIGIANGLDATLINDEVLQYYRRHGENTSVMLVNNLKPVSSLTVIADKLFRLIKNRGVKELTDSRSRAQLLLTRVQCLKKRLELNEDALANFENSLIRDLGLLEFRIRARSSNLAQRMTLVLSKKNRQLYGGRGAIKKIIRDILA